MLPTSSRYAASASLFILERAGADGSPGRKRQSAQARRHVTSPPDIKLQSSAGTLSIGQVFESSSSFAGGQSTFLQGRVGSLQRPQGTVAPNTNNDYARELAADSWISQMQAHDAAV